MKAWRYKFVTLGMAIGTLTLQGCNSSSSSPLYTDFKAFCADTEARPDAVKAAVEAANGKLDYGPASTHYPWPMTSTGWRHVINGVSINVSTGTNQTNAVPPRYPATDSDNCIIATFVPDDVGVKAIRDWAGVPGSVLASGVPSITVYEFLKSDRKHSPAPKDEAMRQVAQAEGRFWSLTIYQDASGANIHLAHVTSAGQATSVGEAATK